MPQNRQKQKRDNRPKYMVILAIICAAASILVPAVIHILHKTPSLHPFLEATWSSGEMLDYIGSLLGAVATIGTVVATIRFTHNESAEEHRLEWMPYFVIGFSQMDSFSVPEGTVAFYALSRQTEKYLQHNANSHPASGIVTLENVGNGAAVDFEISLSEFNEKEMYDNLFCLGTGTRERLSSHISPHETGAISICIWLNYNDSDLDGIDVTSPPPNALGECRNYHFGIDIHYRDILNNNYVQKVIMQVQSGIMQSADGRVRFSQGLSLLDVHDASQY